MDITNNTAVIEALLLEEIPDCDEESDAGVSDDEVENIQLPSPRGLDEVFERALENILAEDPPLSPSKHDELECPSKQCQETNFLLFDLICIAMITPKCLETAKISCTKLDL